MILFPQLYRLIPRVLRLHRRHSAPHRLAKSICAQIKERLQQSHTSFANALKQLETRHSGRLEKTEEQRLKMRKIHAPKVARLALESTSMKDFILYGK